MDAVDTIFTAIRYEQGQGALREARFGSPRAMPEAADMPSDPRQADAYGISRR